MQQLEAGLVKLHTSMLASAGPAHDPAATCSCSTHACNAPVSIPLEVRVPHFLVSVSEHRFGLVCVPLPPAGVAGSAGGMQGCSPAPPGVSGALWWGPATCIGSSFLAATHKLLSRAPGLSSFTWQQTQLHLWPVTRPELKKENML